MLKLAYEPQPDLIPWDGGWSAQDLEVCLTVGWGATPAAAIDDLIWRRQLTVVWRAGGPRA